VSDDQQKVKHWDNINFQQIFSLREICFGRGLEESNMLTIFLVSNQICNLFVCFLVGNDFLT